jgi:uncharacterized membrane protein
MSLTAIEYSQIATLIGKMIAEESERNKAAEGVLIGKIDGLQAMITRSIKRADGLTVEFESIAKTIAAEAVAAGAKSIVDAIVKQAIGPVVESIAKRFDTERAQTIELIERAALNVDAKAAAELQSIANQLRDEIATQAKAIPLIPGQR